MKVKIKEIGQVITGNTPSKKNEVFWNSNDIGFVKPDLLDDKKIVEINKTSEFISNNAKNKARIAQKGDIMVTCIASVGKLGIANSELAFNQQINTIHPRSDINSKYLAYALLSNVTKLKQVANSAVVPIINKNDFENIEIDISLDSNHQTMVVNNLEKVSDIISLRKQELLSLDDLIKARFVEMFSGEKNIKPLDRLVTKITDGSHNPPKGIEKSDYLMLSSQNIWETLDLNNVRYLSKDDFEAENKRTDINDGDVLLTIVGTLGRTHVVQNGEKYVFQRSVAVLKPINNLIDGVYLSSYLKTDDAISQLEKSGHGSSQKGIYLQDLKKLMIPIPSIEKQTEFKKFVKQVDKSKVAIQKSLDLYQELFNKLMNDYFGD